MKLAREINQKDLPYIASCFDNIELFVDAMELSPHEETDVRTTAATHGTQVAMNRCLKCWRTHSPSTATFGALLNMLLRLRKEQVADKVCKYLAEGPV